MLIKLSWGMRLLVKYDSKSVKTIQVLATLCNSVVGMFGVSRAFLPELDVFERGDDLNFVNALTADPGLVALVYSKTSVLCFSKQFWRNVGSDHLPWKDHVNLLSSVHLQKGDKSLLTNLLQDLQKGARWGREERRGCGRLWGASLFISTSNTCYESFEMVW